MQNISKRYTCPLCSCELVEQTETTISKDGRVFSTEIGLCPNEECGLEAISITMINRLSEC